MSERIVEIVRISQIDPHPNADRLEIVNVHGGYPCLVRKGEFQVGDLAAYIPVDMVVPDTEQFHFLARDGVPVGSVHPSYRRVKAKRLRGIFSMGILVHAPDGTSEGEDVTKLMGCEPYDPPENADRHGNATSGARQAKRPKAWDFPEYTDIQPLRKYQDVLQTGEEVVITCKLHGSNMRAIYWHDIKAPWWNRVLVKLGLASPPMRLWVGSHHGIWQDGDCEWWQVAKALGLEESLKRHPGIILFGESLGCFASSGYSYDSGGKAGGSFRAFDALDLAQRRYLDYDEFLTFCRDIGVQTVPELYRGPWSVEKAWELSEGPDPINPKHIREGVVIKPVVERRDPHVGRVILKLPSESYLLGKQKGKKP